MKKTKDNFRGLLSHSPPLLPQHWDERHISPGLGFYMDTEKLSTGPHH